MYVHMKGSVLILFWMYSTVSVLLIDGEKTNTFASRNNSLTWLEGLKSCSDTDGNQSMASNESLASTNTDILLRDLNGTAGWLYGIEGRSKNDFGNFIISSLVPSNKLIVKCTGNNGSDTSFSSATMKYKGSSKYCNETLHGGKLVDITDTKAQIENRGLSETPIWVGSVNEAKLIREFNVKCLLLDETGQLKSDNCSNRHKVICISEILKPTLKYVDSKKFIDTYEGPLTTAPATSPSTEAETTSQGTSQQVVTTTDNSSSRVTFKESTDSTGSKSTAMPPDTGNTLTLILFSGGGAVVIGILIIAICCCACRRKSKKQTVDTKLSEVYSDAADSIVIKRQSDLEDKKDYATPEDALPMEKARVRTSVAGDEYDVLSDVPKPKNSSKDQINVYNHVQIAQAEEDNTYDVTSLARNKTNVQHHNDVTGNTYGQVRIKVTD